MEAFDRRYRETVGRICCNIAKQAEEVIRIVCGIPIVLKNKRYEKEDACAIFVYLYTCIAHRIFIGHMLWRPALDSSPCSLDGSTDFRSGKIHEGLFSKSKAVQRFAGVCLAVIVPLISTAIPLGILILAHWIHPALHFIIASIFCYQMLAAKSLKQRA